MEDIIGTFTIGQLARRAGINLQTVCYYERRKLLLPLRRKKSGYRLYDENALKGLLFIRHAKEIGFTLEGIRGLLNLRVKSADSAGSCEAVRARAGAKLKGVVDKITALESVRKILIELVSACRRGGRLRKNALYLGRLRKK